MIKEVYGRIQYIEERGKFRKCEESGSWVWEKNKYRSEKARKVKYSRRTRFLKKESY